MLHVPVVLAVMLAAMSGSQIPETVRLATFNIWELSTAKLDQVDDRGHGVSLQLRKAAEIIQRVRPDVLLINEIDFDAEARKNAATFAERYLKVGQNGQEPIEYAYVFFEPVNTGVPTGLDLDHDGRSDGPADAIGYGRYPGQYGMAVYSRFPIDAQGARTFQKLLWQAMPGNLMPDGGGDKPAWYSPEEAAVLRLSSKSHWDVPVRIGDAVLHVLASHPTPPVFDGPEDRNGRRTFDEIRLWADYITGGRAAEYVVDDRGQRGGLAAEASFVILGDLNAEPFRDPAAYGRPAIDQLLRHPRVKDPVPKGKGGAASPKAYPGEPACRTAEFGRIDYVLPSKDLLVRDSGVFWPAPDDPLHVLVDPPEASSDHHLVWVDVIFPASH
ncbi:MAG TPA: endonuclease/exonuclease/phosphatase family protein [Phycisphaerae bacterium]|nr:endonuclease/exonuclease/phosphatase family protein [Phycisphaerae bacterium]